MAHCPETADMTIIREDPGQWHYKRINQNQIEEPATKITDTDYRHISAYLPPLQDTQSPFHNQ